MPKEPEWDVFISHAWEDKESFARPLSEALEREGLRVWFDEFTLTVGDKLRRSIDRGLANARYGVVILSRHFFQKEWPQRELDGLLDREISGEKVVLPIWHEVSVEEVREYSHILADRVALSSNLGLEYVVAELLQVVQLGGLVEEVRGVYPETVLVPAGPFLMGSTDDNKLSGKDEHPQHSIYLDSFRIGRYPVTNAQYALFVEAGGYAMPECWTQDGWTWLKGKTHLWGGFDQHESEWPVGRRTWYEAVAYCRWLSEVTRKPYRLPSEAEWEKAARGTDGREWPWGNGRYSVRSRFFGSEITTPVGQHSPDRDSPYGVADMAGDVREWTRSLYEPYPYDPEDGREDLEAASGGRILRGGWGTGRCAARFWSYTTIRYKRYGFRVALSHVARSTRYS